MMGNLNEYDELLNVNHFENILHFTVNRFSLSKRYSSNFDVLMTTVYKRLMNFD